MSKSEVAIKQAQAVAAREAFMGTLHQLQHRLSPKTIARDVKEMARDKADGAINAARDGVQQAANHPSAIAAVAVPVLAFLFRKPIGRGVRALFGRSADLPLQPYEAARNPAPLSTEPLRAPERTLADQGV